MKNLIKLLAFSFLPFCVDSALASSCGEEVVNEQQKLTPFQKRVLEEDFGNDMNKYIEHVKKMESSIRRVEKRLNLDKKEKKSHKK